MYVQNFNLFRTVDTEKYAVTDQQTNTKVIL